MLKKGISIIIFPQSTRSLEFKPEDFNSLGVKLAKKAGVEVVPVAIRTDYWGNGKWIKELGPIDRHKPINIKFGEPFGIQGNGKEENQKIIDFIKCNPGGVEIDDRPWHCRDGSRPVPTVNPSPEIPPLPSSVLRNRSGYARAQQAQSGYQRRSGKTWKVRASVSKFTNLF